MDVYFAIFYLANNIFYCFGNSPADAWDCSRHCPNSCYEKGFPGKNDNMRQQEIKVCLETQLECGCGRLEEDAAHRKQYVILAAAFPIGFLVLFGILLLVRYCTKIGNFANRV